jgi:hypothetical protein
MRKENDVIDVSITPEVLEEDRRIIKEKIDKFLRENNITLKKHLMLYLCLIWKSFCIKLGVKK